MKKVMSAVATAHEGFKGGSQLTLTEEFFRRNSGHLVGQISSYLQTTNLEDTCYEVSGFLIENLQLCLTDQTLSNLDYSKQDSWLGLAQMHDHLDLTLTKLDLEYTFAYSLNSNFLNDRGSGTISVTQSDYESQIEL